MLYQGQFSDKNNNIYSVEIRTGSSTTPVTLKFGGDPCTISSSSSGLFAPIKSRSCTLSIVVSDYIMDLYQAASRGAKVKILDNDNNTIFLGYLTPCVYDMSYTYLDTVELNVVDAVSTCKDYKWNNNNQYNSFISIILDILNEAGYTDVLYVPQSYSKINSTTISNDHVLDKLFVSSNNFLADDEAKTPWTQYEVLEEIMKFMGWSLCPFGNNVWLIDYRAENAGTVKYTKYSISSKNKLGTTYSSPSNGTAITLSSFSGGQSSLSIDDVYSKIEISDNLYEIDTVTPDIFDDDLHISVTDDIQSKQGITALNRTQWIKTQTSGALWWTKTKERIIGTDYQTICKLNDKSGWTHKFYRISTLSSSSPTQVSDYYDSSNPTQYNKQPINKYVNTHCCLVQHYANLKPGESALPTSLDWTDILTFFVYNDTLPLNMKFTEANIAKLERPVLEYTTGESVNWKPISGTSWITIKGDMFLQYTGKKTEEGNLYIVNDETKIYSTAPVDNTVNVADNKKIYNNIFRTYGATMPAGYGQWGDGFEMWKMKLKIGNKYWNGSSWTTTESTFYIKYNNHPKQKDNNTWETEYMPCFEWASPMNNSDYQDKVGVDGYCIPIAYNDNNAPDMGVMTLTIYTPRVETKECMTIMPDSSKSIIDAEIPWVVYVKDFEVGFVYTDSSVWWNNHENKNKADKVYVGYIDDEYVNEFDGLEMKINTVIPDRPISRSYVTTSNGYLKTMKHKQGDADKSQEYNVIDEYLDHHSEPKTIFNANLHGMFSPENKFSSSHFTGKLMIDNYSFDVRNNNNNIKFIEF